MNAKRWIAGVAALVLAGSASLFLANPAQSHGDEDHEEEPGHEDDGHDDGGMDHEDDGHDDMDHGDDGMDGEDDGGPAEPAPPVTEEPGFTG